MGGPEPGRVSSWGVGAGRSLQLGGGARGGSPAGGGANWGGASGGSPAGGVGPGVGLAGMGCGGGFAAGKGPAKGLQLGETCARRGISSGRVVGEPWGWQVLLPWDARAGAQVLGTGSSTTLHSWFLWRGSPTCSASPRQRAPSPSGAWGLSPSYLPTAWLPGDTVLKGDGTAGEALLAWLRGLPAQSRKGPVNQGPHGRGSSIVPQFPWPC